MGRPRNRIKKKCCNCEKEFEVRPSEIKKGGGKFCSRSCATTYRNIHDNPAWSDEVRKKISKNHADVSGEKNPMYGRRGEKAPSYIDGRNSFKGEIYRKMLLASGAEKKCKICGKTEKLHVHHLDGNHKNNNINNLVWLCTNCHYNIAHKYSRDDKGRLVKAEINQL